MNLLISMPGGAEWIIIFFLVFVVIGIPIVCYRAGYRTGKRDGELEALRQNKGAAK